MYKPTDITRLDGQVLDRWTGIVATLGYMRCRACCESAGNGAAVLAVLYHHDGICDRCSESL